jgi:2-dehydro-3-deoxygalactonokinase
MIGSRQGWKEAPYFDCPATLASLATRLTTVDIAVTSSNAPTRQLHIVGGLKCIDSSGEFDVMRGEEVQIWGAGLVAHSCCVLPGTHSKWAWLGGSGEVSHFKTFMTGELFSVLTQHTILGRLMEFGSGAPSLDTSAFTAGVELALGEPAQLSHTLFAVRTAGLMGRIAPAALPDYLSGLLLGAEIAGATVDAKPAGPITLIGEDALCHRYALALKLAGIASTQAAQGATTRGQCRVAVAAGLVKSAG